MKKPKDDIAVRGDEICKLFDPPLKKTSFHDKVNAGKIAMAGDLRGYYLLNATRLINGFPEVDIQAYRASKKHNTSLNRDLLLRHAAILCLDPDLAPLLPYVQFPESLDNHEVSSVRKHIDQLQPAYDSAKSVLEQLAVIKGWIESSQITGKT